MPLRSAIHSNGYGYGETAPASPYALLLSTQRERDAAIDAVHRRTLVRRLLARATRTLWGAAAPAVLALILMPAAGMAHGDADASAPGADARGLVNTGLATSTDADCRGLLVGERSGVCTHGPDAAPPGRDVREAPSTAQLRREAGLPAKAATAATTPGTTTTPVGGAGGIVCSGNGTADKRVEVLYVRATDRADRFASVRDVLGRYVIDADRQLNLSAAETGGVRHWRFVTDPDPAGAAPCVLRITKVDVSPADDDNFDATIAALSARGYTRADRKYLVFVDADVYCGIGSIRTDSQPGQANLNNGSVAQYARIDANCWHWAAAHELMHNIGGVQPDAPHATPGFHCTDTNDVMCYDDDGAGPVFMRLVCSGRSDRLFDCNHDDYFVAGLPPAGAYLATHWNTAASAFLINPAVARVVVPDVRQEFSREAGQAIRDAGLSPSFNGSTSPYAWVASQSPGPGTYANQGSTVTLRMLTGMIP